MFDTLNIFNIVINVFFSVINDLQLYIKTYYVKRLWLLYKYIQKPWNVGNPLSLHHISNISSKYII